jgi:hypothetical protein
MARRLSLIVVFPWSMWAMMPMFLMCSLSFISFNISLVCLNLGM